MQKNYFYCVQNCDLECALFVLTNEYIITGSVPLWKYSKMSLTRARLNGLRHQLFRTTISCFYASSKALSIVLIKSVTCSMMSGVIITAWRMRIARSMPWQDVCLSSVRPSAKVFLPSGSPTILVFLHQTGWQYSDGDSLNEGAECRGYEKITIFDQYRALSRNWCKIEP